jgi:hypothetical protein
MIQWNTDSSNDLLWRKKNLLAFQLPSSFDGGHEQSQLIFSYVNPCSEQGMDQPTCTTQVIGSEDAPKEVSLLLLFRGITRYSVERPRILSGSTQLWMRQDEGFEVSRSERVLPQLIPTYSHDQRFPIVGIYVA